MTTRDAYLRRTYDLTERQYTMMFKAQGGRCPICLKRPPQGKPLCVDHVHGGKDAGRVRGLLCVFCNRRVIGRLKSAELLVRAAKYLSRTDFDGRALGVTGNSSELAKPKTTAVETAP